MPYKRNRTESRLPRCFAIPRPYPSLLIGVAGLFDFAGVIGPRTYRSPRARDESTLEAILEDWRAVGTSIVMMLPPEDGSAASSKPRMSSG